MKRRSPLRSHPKPRTAEETEAAERWIEAVRGKTLRGGRVHCAVTGAAEDFRDPVQGHHVIAQQRLRRFASAHGMDPVALVWDPRNGMPVARSRHGQHTLRGHPIPRSALLESNWEFAREHGLDWMLERDYPE